ncbi:hypothetical protein MOQ_003930 [Trypanosoma cruzi marinkellei]|uniref:Uncharacterized protein n=1 Tax=Trypanosoma cruzi marinkellei TaxID=85056 RepID=K2MAQ6_TRYCR|nr:hypothetical protein MOQ_003930 [Trypanosoma cruzi marinkellei]
MRSAPTGITQEHENCAMRRGLCNQANAMLHGGNQTPPRPRINHSQAACRFMDSPFWFQPRRNASVAQHQPGVVPCRQGNQVRMTEYIIGKIALNCGKRHRTHRKQVRMLSLHVSCAVFQMKENSEKRKSAHSPPPQAVLSGRSRHQAGDSTLVVGYRDALTRPRACPQNILFPFPPPHASTSSFKPHLGESGWRVAPGQSAPFHSSRHQRSKPQNHWPSINDAVDTRSPLANATHLFRRTCYPMPR